MRDRNELAESIYNLLRHLRRYQHLAEGSTGLASRCLAILTPDVTLARDALLLRLKEGESEWIISHPQCARRHPYLRPCTLS